MVTFNEWITVDDPFSSMGDYNVTLKPVFKPGQRVHVEYDTVIVNTAKWTPGAHNVKHPVDAYGNATVPDRFITALDPESWPPQVGDLWTADGEDFFVREHRGIGHSDRYFIERAKATSNVGETTYSDRSLNEFKTLNPTLVRRAGQ
jgi:hypothetical protein